MVAANQEISPALQALAMKDPRFRKGQSRNKAGGKFSAAGAKRRVSHMKSFKTYNTLRISAASD